MRHLYPLIVFALTLTTTSCGQARISLNAQTQSAIGARALASKTDPIEGLKNFNANLNTFAATVTFWESIPSKTQTDVAEVATARPEKIRANITSSTVSMRQGVQILYLGDKKVKLKLGFITQTKPYDDDSVTSLHNWRLDQTNLSSMINGITDPAGQVTQLGPALVNGVETVGISVKSPSLLPGVDSETVDLDAKTFMPVRLRAYIGSYIVYRVDIDKARINPVLPPNTFVL